MASEELAPAPKRRLYSPELKNQVVAQARLPGASIAGVALSHGINANIVHRWLRERAGVAPAQPGFVALSMAPVNAPMAPQADTPAQPAQDIRIELRRGATVVNVAWPVALTCPLPAYQSKVEVRVEDYSMDFGVDGN